MTGFRLRLAVFMLFLLCWTEASFAQTPGRGLHPLMPNQELFLRCRVGQGEGAAVIDTPLPLPSFTSPADIQQTVDLPAPLNPIQVRRYFPSAVMRQEARADTGPDAAPLILVALEGPTQTFERWLAAGDSERNRLISFIGTWRYMRVEAGENRDKLFDAFANELTREPALLISKPDGSAHHRVSVVKNDSHALDDLNCTVRIKEFFSNFAFDEKKARPVNQSDQRLNPAALVEFNFDGKIEERWMFAKFPDFNSGKAALPLNVKLDCPIESSRAAPDFAIVTIGGRKQEVWTRHSGDCRSQKISLRQHVKIPESSYEFHVADYIAKGVLRERYEPGETTDAVRVVEVEFAAAGGATDTVWLAMGKPRVVETGAGQVTLWFGPRTRSVGGTSAAHQTP